MNSAEFSVFASRAVQLPSYPAYSQNQPIVDDSSDPSTQVRARTTHSLQVHDLDVDLAGVEGLVELSQTRAVGHALCWMQARIGERPHPAPRRA